MMSFMKHAWRFHASLRIVEADKRKTDRDVWDLWGIGLDTAPGIMAMPELREWITPFPIR